MSHLIWWIPLAIFSGFAFMGLVVAPYLLHKEDKAIADATELKSQEKIRELIVETGRRPELEILFDDTSDDYVYRYPFGPPTEVMVRLYKAAVRVKGGKTIENVNLELVAMEPRPPNSFFPLPLHPIHEKVSLLVPSASGANFPTGIQYGGLNPETLRFFDVILMPENGQGWMQIYTTAPVTCQFQRGRYVLKLRANGLDAIPSERLFMTEVNAEGKLMFYPQDSN